MFQPFPCIALTGILVLFVSVGAVAKQVIIEQFGLEGPYKGYPV